MGNNSEFATSSDELAEKVGESKNQIFRYIRLTELVPKILQMVDERQIAFRPAVEISYLTEEQQYTLLEAMEYNDATPSLAQAIKMKKYNQDGKLTSEVIQSIMEEEKPNQKEVDELLGIISETAPSTPKSGDYWYKVDHSAKSVTLMKYSGAAWAATTDKQSLTYTWYAQDKDGKEVTFGKTGKVIYLSATDIDSIMTLQCDVSN